MATYVVSNKRILSSGLNVGSCSELTSYDFDSFPKKKTNLILLNFYG